MRKKALLVGINAYASAPLYGCVNDIKAMKEVLTSLYGFSQDNIRLLTDKEATSKAIVDGLGWLAQDSEEKSVRVFHYAGHGHFVPDTSGDEPDGADEALVPYDQKKSSYLIDDKLKELYVRFSANSSLTLIMDCCHAGSNNRGPDKTINYRFIPPTYAERKAISAAKKKFHEAQRAFVMQEVNAFAKVRGRDVEFERRIEAAMEKFRKMRFGDVRTSESNVLLAACQSDQQAADAKIGRNFNGAFTYYLVKALRDANGRISYRKLIENTAKELDAHRFVQVPQLECIDGRDRVMAFSAL